MLSSLGQASFALLMISSVGLVLNRQVSFRKMLIEYFLMALFAYLVTVFFIAQTIQTVLYGLPSAIPELQSLANELNLGDVIKGVLTRTATMVLPGDGSVHIGALNNLAAAFGTELHLPEIEQLISMIPENGFTHA